MTTRLIPLLILSLPFAVACSDKPSQSIAAKVESAEISAALAGSNMKATPQTAAAIQQLAAMGQAPKPARAQVVPFALLEPLFPAAPAGWTAEAPSGESASIGPMQVSSAKRRYRKGDESMLLTISDMSHNPGAAMIPLAFSIQQQDDRGYQKPFSLSGQQGSEHWNKLSKAAQVTLFTSSQLLLQVDGQGLADPKPARDLLASFDLSKLAAVAK